MTSASLTAPTSELASRALDVDQANLALGHETFEAEGAKFVRNRAFPRIYDANHVTHVMSSTPHEIDRLLARVEIEYEGIGHREFGVDYRTPPTFTARLALEGYDRRDSLVMLLEGDLIGEATEHEIRPLETNEDWQAYAELHALDWRENAERTKHPEEDASVPQQMRATHRAKQPPVQYWLAYAEERPVAYFNSWGGIGGVGQVEDLFTHPHFRHRGLATALIRHCVADCRRKGAGPVVIVADPTDTPKQIYAGMGFRPVAIYSHYLKKVVSPGNG